MSNYWTTESIKLAKEKNYLDILFKIYPVVTRRDTRRIQNEIWENIHTHYINKDYFQLIKELFKCEKFPFDNAYVAFLKEDPTALERNPDTVNRLGSFLCNDLQISEIFDGITQPKKTSRSMGPMFKNWLLTKPLGLDNYFDVENFLKCEKGILIGGDSFLKDFAERYLKYRRNKGIDFIAKINNKMVVGETKFITASGGTQDKSFKDVVSLLECEFSNEKFDIIPIGIVDGYPLLNKGHYFSDFLKNQKPILSSLLLRDFLFSLVGEEHE